MSDILYNEESLLRYLLGQMDEDDQTRIEEKYFADPDYFQLLQILEGELIDAYVCDQLSETDRRAFESLFLQSPERRGRVELVRAVKQRLDRDEMKPAVAKKTRKPSLFDFLRWRPIYLLPLVTSLLLTFGFAFLFFETARLQRDLEQARHSDQVTQQKAQELEAQLDRERQHAAELAKDLEAAKSPHQTDNPDNSVTPVTPSPVLLATLFANADRGKGGSPRIQLSPFTETVKFTLPFVGEDVKTVSASLKVVGGDELFTKADLPVTATRLRQQTVWALPTKDLREGDYVISLKAADARGEVNEVAKFAFRLLRKSK